VVDVHAADCQGKGLECDRCDESWCRSKDKCPHAPEVALGYWTDDEIGGPDEQELVCEDCYWEEYTEFNGLIHHNDALPRGESMGLGPREEVSMITKFGQQTHGVHRRHPGC
jgi:hypothetical protein